MFLWVAEVPISKAQVGTGAASAIFRPVAKPAAVAVLLICG